MVVSWWIVAFLHSESNKGCKSVEGPITFHRSDLQINSRPI